MAKVIRKGETTIVQIPGKELLFAQYPMQPEISFGQVSLRVGT